MIFAFGPFELDDSAGTLRCRDEVVALQPRVYNVLCYLVQHRDRVVSSQELTNVFWDGRTVNRGAVPWTIGHARKALTSYAPAERFIETVRQRGYRFAGAVRERRTSSEGGGRALALSQPMDGSLIGREAILRDLHGAWAAARAGRGSMLLLSGDAGAGKTRLAAELAEAARALGIEPWIGQRESHGADAPLSHFAQVLSQAQSDASVGGTLYDEASSLLVSLDARAPETRGSFWLSDRISRFVARAARDQPRCVVLDDLHRAGEATLRALDLLMLDLRRSQLLIVASARELVAPGEHAAAELALRYRECDELRVAGLSPAEVERYLTQVIGAAPSAQLSQAVYAKTDGNPRFVREVAHVLAARRKQGLSIRATDVAIPEVARDFVVDRLAFLAPSTRLVLEAAAAQGGDVEVTAVAAATGLSVHDVLRAIEQAIGARVLIALPDAPRYAFAMPLLRAVLSERSYSMIVRPGSIGSFNHVKLSSST